MTPAVCLVSSNAAPCRWWTASEDHCSKNGSTLSTSVRPVGCVVVVHGHHAARMQRIAHCLCSGGIHCVNAPYWHQHGVHRADGRRLLHRQLVPQIAQMDHRQAAGCKNPDRVGPPQRAAPVIMKGLNLPGP